MFSRRPKVPAHPDLIAWVEKSWELLTQLFGEDWYKKAPLVLPNEEFFPRKWEGTEDWSRFAFGCVCDLMHIDRARVKLEFMREDLYLTKTRVEETPHVAAGLYHELKTEEGPARAVIYIRETLIRDPERMVATMAHELCHLLLLGDRKIPRDKEHMEPLTDLMTVFSGFGILNANACKEHRSNLRGWQLLGLGYLWQRDYGYALAWFAWKRGEQRPIWAKELSRNVRTFMKESLAWIKRIEGVID